LVLATFLSFLFLLDFSRLNLHILKAAFQFIFSFRFTSCFLITICSLWNDFFLISSPFNFFHLSNLVFIFFIVICFLLNHFLNWIYFSISPFNIFFILFLCQILSLFFYCYLYYFGNFFRFKYFILFFNIKFIRK
jgi:hypothetical protein